MSALEGYSQKQRGVATFAVARGVDSRVAEKSKHSIKVAGGAMDEMRLDGCSGGDATVTIVW